MADVVQVECSLCKDTFMASEITLNRIIVNREKEYLITYYQCPKCGAYFVVMVEDEISLQAKEAFEGLKAKVRFCWNVKKPPSKTLIQKMNEAKSRMMRQTRKLKFEFPETFYQFDELKLENINKRPFTESKIGESEETDVN